MWFLNALKTSLIWLRDGLLAIFTWIGQRPLMAALAVCIALPIAVVGYRSSRDIGDWLDRADVGQIIVNSPTVYTRQRLVNDRLSQTQWLQEQLKHADRDFRSIAQLRKGFVERAFMLGEASAPAAGSTTPSQTGAASPRPREPDAESSDDTQVKLTTAALFRAKNSYREEVRAEMTQTQLDDRHDIQGNTIYRLAFDATVLAGTKKDAAAAIKVTIGHHPLGDKPRMPSKFGIAAGSPVTAQPVKINETLRKLYDDDYQQLYLDWIRYTQTQIEKSLLNISSSIPSNAPEPRARLLFTQFVLVRVCELALGITNLNDAFFEYCDPDHPGAAPNIREIAKANLRQAGLLLNAYANVRFTLIARMRKDRFIETMKRLEVLNDQSTNIDEQRWLRQAQGYCFQNNKFSIAPIEIGIFPKPGPQPGPNEPPKTKMPEFLDCPFVDSPSERMIAGVLLYTQLLNAVLPKVTSNKLPDDLGKAFENYPPEGFTKTLADQLRQPNQNNPACRRETPDEQALCDYPNQEAATRCFAADFARVNLNAFERRYAPLIPMKQFLTLDISGREINDCQLVVSALPEKQGAIKKLKDSLNKSTETFAYSISPKNLSESISTSEETKDAFDAMMRLRLSLTDKDSANSLGLRRNRTDHIEGNFPYPLVVGFGSSRQIQPDGETAPDRSSSEKSAVIRTAVVGWVIAPRLRSGRRPEQIDGQHSLTAVISVPSWWRSVELDIETCWISREDLRTLPATESSGIEICKEGAKQIESTMIRLPGAIQELSRKLGFEVVQEPYLNSDAPQRLEVGEPGQLLLSGGRLWRSTEVTVGSQKADSITVLPNMEGVVAKFNCVLPQSGMDRYEETRTVARTITTAMLRVWTSEGVTFPVPVELVQNFTNAPPPSPDPASHPGTNAPSGPRPEPSSGPAGQGEPASARSDGPGRKPPKYCAGWYDDVVRPPADPQVRAVSERR